MNKESVITLRGKQKGKTLAIFAGIHGNEKVGVYALKQVLKNIVIEKGTVHFVFANPPAIAKNKRFVHKNLNRLFIRSNINETYEDARARELMKLLDTCDALLDIHSYNSKTGNQFAIGEVNTFRLVKEMDFPIVVSGFSAIGHGTDGYMYKNGKVGLCVECGTSNRAKKFTPLAVKTIYQFLKFYGSISKSPYQISKRKKVFLKAERMIIKQSKQFTFKKQYKDFDLLKAGSVYAIDGDAKLIAAKNNYIVFPRPNVEVGGEVCVICKKIQ